MTVPETVDVVIVGSGPVGCTFAREMVERVPTAKVLLVEAGPRLTSRAGMHVKNIPDPTERTHAQVISQGPTAYPYNIPSIAERSRAGEHERKGKPDTLARPGTFLLDYSGDGSSGNLIAAAMSTNVGGMGAHWTCACPRPGNAERVPFIPEREWDQLAGRAEHLLRVTRRAFPESAASRAIIHMLGEVFNPDLPEDRRVGTMPLACSVAPSGQRLWSGPDVVLGGLADADASLGNFTILANTVCLRLETGDRGATSAVLRTNGSDTQFRVRAKIFVVAADALRTPQILAASSLGGRANGRYLNDQPQSISLVELKDEVLAMFRRRNDSLAEDGERADPTIGVLWVPFHAPSHPFHGQVMHLDTSPIPVATSGGASEKGNFVALGWFAAKTPRFEDYIEFSDRETDFYGLPKMHIHYELTQEDKAAILASNREQERAARAFGWFLPGAEPRTMPAGSSLHYQGTTRMGDKDDGTSVCDPYSRVWGTDNVFVGGNNVIPTATACNPTMSSVALAVRAAQRVAALLS